jgi:hypothetical protein
MRKDRVRWYISPEELMELEGGRAQEAHFQGLWYFNVSSLARCEIGILFRTLILSAKRQKTEFSSCKN